MLSSFSLDNPPQKQLFYIPYTFTMNKGSTQKKF